MSAQLIGLERCGYPYTPTDTAQRRSLGHFLSPLILSPTDIDDLKDDNEKAAEESFTLLTAHFAAARGLFHADSLGGKRT